MNKLSKNLLVVSGLLVVWGFITSHFAVFSLEERTIENLFIVKANAVENYLLAIFFILLAIWFKKHD